MLGARFDGHPWTQDFAIDVVDGDHPATVHLGPGGSGATRSTSSRTCDPTPTSCCASPTTRSISRSRVDARPTAASPSPGACRTAPPAPSTARSGTSPEPGKPRPICSTWPVASPGWWPAHNLTPMSGSSLPEVMAAAVYQSPGVLTVEERKVPRPGPDQLVVRVARVRHLRVRHPSAPRRVGHGARCRRRPRMERDDRRHRRERHGLVGRRTRGGRRGAALRHLPALPGGQAVAVREPQQHDRRAGRRRLRRIHPVPVRRRPPPPRGPLAPPCRAGRAPLRGAARHHPLGRRAGRQRHGLRRGPDRRADRGRAAGHG